MYANRIDPSGCGCADCCCGESVPLDNASPEELLLMVCGKIENASEEDAVVCIPDGRGRMIGVESLETVLVHLGVMS